MFFLKKEDRPGRAPPQAARYRARWTSLRRLGGLNPLGNSRGFRSWRVLGPILTLSWLILAFKTPPRASKTPPRRPQDAPRRPQEPPRRPRHPLQEAQKPGFSYCFSMISLSRAILTQRGLQDDFKSLQDAFKTPSRASKTPPRASKTDPQASKTPPRASKTAPRPS